MHRRRALLSHREPLAQNTRKNTKNTSEESAKNRPAPEKPQSCEVLMIA